MRLAIVADWLPTYGGAEHVLGALHRLWPEAPIFTTVARRSSLGPLVSADIRTNALLQGIFCILGRHQWLSPWMLSRIELIDTEGYDIVLSSSHAVGKGVIVRPDTVHICYCHTPVRYGWEMEEEYLRDFGIRGPLRWVAQKFLKRLRRWDLSTAKRVDHFIANSTETQRRIREIYGRESVVISPPVDSRFFEQPLLPDGTNKTSPYFLALGRLVPYKRFDLLIALANHLHLPLKIGGTGSDLRRLKRLAGPTIEFLGFVPDEDLPSLYAGAECLLFPQVEDAGIVPLEAQACGVPVIAYGKGGVCDVVVDGVTGFLMHEQTVDAFADGIRRLRERLWDRSAIRESAERFREGEFQRRMAEAVDAMSSTSIVCERREE
jgi:glycosyltransferase involved in cell wall biosynthesis